MKIIHNSRDYSSPEQEFKAALDVPGIDERDEPPVASAPEPEPAHPALDAPGAQIVRAKVPASVLRQVSCC